MFFKKKDKGGETPAKGAPEARREESRREEPRREEPRRQEPPRQSAPTPQAAPPPPAAPAKPGAGAAIDAALAKARGPAGAPISFEALTAQTAAADRLASSNDPADREAARDLAAGAIEKGFSTLFSAAGKDPAQAAARWRTLGALAFTVDARQSRFAYLSAFNLPERQFWDGIWLARLRGQTGELVEALEAADMAGNLAANDAERSIAHCEYGLILNAGGDNEKALKHAEQAIALAPLANTPETQRQAVVRLVLLGSAAQALQDLPRARKAFADALALGRQLGSAAPRDPLLAVAVCELLEKCGLAASLDKDHAAAVASIEEALNIRRRLSSVLPVTEVDRGIARSLTMKGELLLQAGDGTSAAAAFDESLRLLRKLAETQPQNPAAQQELWRTMWHMASAQGPGPHWNAVVATMEKMQNGGALDAEGRRFLEEGRRRVPA